jgi:hypothetical protein
MHSFASQLSHFLLTTDLAGMVEKNGVAVGSCKEFGASRAAPTASTAKLE